MLPDIVLVGASDSSIVRNRNWSGRQDEGFGGKKKEERMECEGDDEWEDLPSMPFPLFGCFGICYGDKFVVVGKRDLPPNHDASVIFNPLEQKWHVVEYVEPMCKFRHHDMIILESNIYSSLEDGTVTVRSIDQKDWRTLGVCPAVVTPSDCRSLKSFRFQFVASGKYLYVVRGITPKYNTDDDVFCQVNLHGIKLGDLTTLPLEWKDTKNMPARGGYIRGCASME